MIRHDRSVMVVEDDPDVREALTAVLRFEGYNVTTAVDGQQALDQLRCCQLPDVILLDLRMPGKDGFQFRAEQIEDPRLADIPVIVFSADDRVREKAQNIKAAGYLKKPVDFRALLHLVDQHTRPNSGFQDPSNWH